MCSRRIFAGREGGAGMPEHLARTIRDHDPQLLAVGLPVEMIAAVPQADGSAQDRKIVRFPFAAPAGARLVGGIAVNVTDLQQAQAQRLKASGATGILSRTGRG